MAFANEPVRKRGYAGILLSVVGAIISSEVLPDQWRTFATTLFILLGGSAGVESSRLGSKGSIGPITHQQALEDRENSVRTSIEMENIKASEDWEAQLLEVQEWRL